jgi:hypothetical protein
LADFEAMPYIMIAVYGIATFLKIGGATMIGRKLREQLVKSKKRHDRRPRSRDLSSAGARGMQRMSRDHADVLQNIEFCLVATFHENPAFDDAGALKALWAMALGELETGDPHADEALQSLWDVRRIREEVTDNVWHDGLRVIMDSVRRQSRLHEGEISYLAFVDGYVV